MCCVVGKTRESNELEQIANVPRETPVDLASVAARSGPKHERGVLSNLRPKATPGSCFDRSRFLRYVTNLC